MRNKFALILDILTILGLLIAGCSLGLPPSTDVPQVVTELPGELPGVSPIPPTGDRIEILSVSPPVPSGVSIVDPVTVMVRYNLTIPEGTFQLWFERFTDADCTIPMADTTGGTTLAGILETAAGGSQEVSYSIPPLPLLEVAYVGVGVRLWTPDNSTILVEDMSYDVCYAVQAPPADMPVAPPELEPIPGGTDGIGAITGITFGDTNGNGLLDSGESGAGPYQLTLADTTCSTTFLITNSDSSGYYGFLALPAGTYCVLITYTSGIVLPGYLQRVEVVANNTSEASFALQTGTAGPPSSGVCGDGVADIGAGEQCDPPNLTDCTATCQSYTGFCGDGNVDPSLGEQCDPPNSTDCTFACQVYVPYCGNFVVDTGESCDPPNLTDCNASCQLILPACGNYIVDFGEQCDPPNTTFCTAQCRLYVPNCGNGIIDIGEQCEPPDTFNCTQYCQSFP